jgi:hypothetical protein
MNDSTVLEAVRDILEAITPPATPAGDLIVLVSPDDEPFTIESFPTIIIEHDYWEEDVYTRYTQADNRATWTLKVSVFLGEKDLPDYEIDTIVRPWHNPIRAALITNPTLNGTVEHYGNVQDDSGEAIRARTQFLHWYNQPDEEPLSYWGIELVMRVTQSVAYAETVGIAP